MPSAPSPRSTPRPSPTQSAPAWDVYAENVTRRNRLGDSIKISGISTFVAFNAPRIQNGQAIITAAPTVFDLGDAGTPGTITIGALFFLRHARL